MLYRNRDHENVARARRLRRETTPPERLLCSRLRDSQTGFRFRRQHPFGPYTLDFYAPSVRVCVEVDSMCHDNRGDIDIRRDAYLANEEILTIRIMASEVFTTLDEVVDRIGMCCLSRTEEVRRNQG